ncbi:MAG TPA: GDSL-type esterase/lipase family protein [Chthonomonadales bacterium]|nr:GDSL-type esterase/lipase family protein [Chthonomonadales bacterium]
MIRRWVVCLMSGLLWTAQMTPFAHCENNPGVPAERGASMSLEEITRRLETGQPVVFATFGDSITWPCFHTDFRQNYITYTVDALQKRYPKAQIRIVHAGNIGTARRGLQESRFEKYVLSHRPDVVFIKFGMNDCVGGPAGLDAYDRNLTELIRKTRETGALPILVTQNEILYDREDGAPRKALPLYMARAREVAAREKTPLAECFALWQQKLTDRESLVLRLNDGIHPNLAGHRLLAKGILQSLWPDAARYVSDEVRTPAPPDGTTATECLLPGPPGKQILRTKDGIWMALTGRRRGGKLSDMVFSYTRKEKPAWSDFRHVTLIGVGSDAVFDHQDRTITAGMFLEQEGKVYVVFSWNVGVFYVRLDTTKPGWESRVTSPAAWLEHTTEPFIRPTQLHHISVDDMVLYDAFMQPNGIPAVFCKDFELAPGAGYEVVEGREGIALVTREAGKERKVDFLTPTRDGSSKWSTPERGNLAYQSQPAPGAASIGILMQEGSRLRFEVRSLGVKP